MSDKTMGTPADGPSMTASTVDHPRRNHSVWIGAAISMLALVSYFAYFARFPSLRDTAWLNLLGIAIGLAISARAFFGRRSLWSAAGFVLSVACSTALIGYVYVLSNQLPGVAGVVEVGETAPDFELLDQQGQTVRLGDFQGSQLMLVFYRGFW